MSHSAADPLASLLLAMHDREASDLHLVPGYRPMYRIHGDLGPAGDSPLAPDQIPQWLRPHLPAKVAGRFDGDTDLDFALQLPSPAGPVRFRVNVFTDRGGRGACFRAIPTHIPTLTELGFPQEIADRVLKNTNGLILLTGITGSGKTTSLAALIQMLNERGGYRIITIEEPIEYLYPATDGSVITQREVGPDVTSFFDGLRSGLRQDPDVILVGEIRDRDTAQLAISAAETGHLIFSTLHTSDAKGAVSRMIDLFPSEMHDDIRSQLSMSLRAVIAQHLLPSERGRRVLAMEVLTANFAVRAAIRQGKIESLDSAIQSGRRDGMFSLDADLRRLVSAGLITIDVARTFAKDPAEFGG